MKTLLLTGLAAVALTASAVAPAQAEGGCGPYAHRGYDGYCHPNGWRPRPVYYGVYGGYGWPHRQWGYGPGWGYRRSW